MAFLPGTAGSALLVIYHDFNHLELAAKTAAFSGRKLGVLRTGRAPNHPVRHW